MKHCFNSPTVDAVLSDVVLLVVLSGLTENLEVPHIRKLFSPQTNKMAFSISAVSQNNCSCLAFIQLQPKGTNRATFTKDLSDLIQEISIDVNNRGLCFSLFLSRHVKILSVYSLTNGYVMCFIHMAKIPKHNLGDKTDKIIFLFLIMIKCCWCFVFVFLIFVFLQNHCFGKFFQKGHSVRALCAGRRR